MIVDDFADIAAQLKRLETAEVIEVIEVIKVSFSDADADWLPVEQVYFQTVGRNLAEAVVTVLDVSSWKPVATHASGSGNGLVLKRHKANVELVCKR